jgi:hypothetical protein
VFKICVAQELSAVRLRRLIVDDIIGGEGVVGIWKQYARQAKMQWVCSLGVCFTTEVATT